MLIYTPGKFHKQGADAYAKSPLASLYFVVGSSVMLTCTQGSGREYHSRVQNGIAFS